MNFKTPILFLIFNRPDTTKLVFEQIRQIKPKFLYVAADGPREDHPDEPSVCQKTRDLVLKGIDWDCEVRTLFREQNKGCGKAVSEAITWFFNNVEQGIILEDDTLPDLTFFHFCESLLEKYKLDFDVFSIGGTNIFGKWKFKAQDYHFSYQGSIWGWATWRRAWIKYKFDIKELNTKENLKILRKLSFKRTYFEKRINLFFNKEFIDTWDYQWIFIRLINNGLTIIPSVNLVSNIGFGSNGTHTKDENSNLSKLNSYSLEIPIKHNTPKVLDRKFELKLLRVLYSKEFNYRIIYYFINKINKFLTSN
jgi:hypothetical protein